MHLFSQDRPLVAHRPALLIDGGTVPNILIAPRADGTVDICVMLRADYQSYTQRTHNTDPDHLPQFFNSLVNDPEATLAYYFDWKPQKPSPAAKVRPSLRLTQSIPLAIDDSANYV